jgi:hypothetical protein
MATSPTVQNDIEFEKLPCWTRSEPGNDPAAGFAVLLDV